MKRLAKPVAVRMSVPVIRGFFTVSMVNERRMRKVLLLKDIDHAPEEVYKNICGGMD